MNAAIIAACAVNGAAAARKARENSQPVYILPEDHFRKVERPIIGMVKILNGRDVVVIDDLKNDGVEVRFHSVYAVDDLIRKLEALKKNMMTLEDDNEAVD